MRKDETLPSTTLCGLGSRKKRLGGARWQVPSEDGQMVSPKAVAMLHAGLPRTISACTLTLLLTAENIITAHACFYTQHLWVRPPRKPGF